MEIRRFANMFLQNQNATIGGGRQPLFGVVFIFLMLAGTVVFGENNSAKLDKLGDDLAAYITTQQPNHPIKVLVALKSRVDAGAYAEALPTRAERHLVVIQELQKTAAETQTALVQFIETKIAAGKVASYRTFWLNNMIAMEATSDAIIEISQRVDVEKVYVDYEVEIIAPVDISPAESVPNGSESGLRESNAPALWEMGITGNGVVVMNIDTGVQGNHPALAANWRGNEPGVPATAAWFNPDVPGQPQPVDNDGHGTHTMGTMVGLQASTNDTIGMAFNAKWIAAGWNYTGVAKFISDVIAEFQWAADPDGDPNTIDDVPAVVNNSWGLSEFFGSPDCDPVFWAAIDNAEAAGVAVVFAAGNEGPSPQSLRTPSDRNTTPYTVFSVGALNSGSNNIASFSSRGPSGCPGTPQERIKPEVSARGVSVRSAFPNGVYAFLSGTSMAAPHVSGAIALLREAFPNASVTELKEALFLSAVDLGAPGEDNTYGNGRIDCLAAYNHLANNSGGAVTCDLTLRDNSGNGDFAYRMNFTNTTTSNQTVQLWGNVTGPDGYDDLVFLKTKSFAAGASAGKRKTYTIASSVTGDYTFTIYTGTYPNNPDHSESAVYTKTSAAAGIAGQFNTSANSTAIPERMMLSQNYPNPFNPETTIRYGVNEENWVSVKIFNTLGQEIKTLVNEMKNAGYHSISWDGKDNNGKSVATGVYLYRMKAGSFTASYKMFFSK